MVSGSAFPSAKIAPSMLSSDFANLAPEAQRMVDCGADWLHMDIMVYIFSIVMTIPYIKTVNVSKLHNKLASMSS